MIDKARFAAFKAATRIFDGAFSNLITAFDSLDGVDRAFAERIAIGTLERRITLEYVLSEHMRKETKSDISRLLMTGVYQILYMDRVPDSAACDETVNIAKKIFGSKVAGFANAVLREICRNKVSIYEKVENAEGYIKFSVNERLFELIKQQYPNRYERIFESFFDKQPLYLRVNTLKSNAKEVANITDGEIISDTAILCPVPKKALDEINSGLYYVQGLASQKAVKLLDAKPGQRVIDMCACPGGKTLGAAIDMENRGEIFAFDLHKNKLSLIRKSAEKLGIDIITVDEQDGRVPRKDLDKTADRVICDVPCSGTGVMGSKPEIKYKSPDDFEGLYLTQQKILETASGYLKNGGEIVYSTCSINKKENEDIITDFLLRNDKFSLVSQETCLPYGDEREGFYMAKIRREFQNEG